mmetsp:Transcript_118943/g.331837  ORF Transcript_118943/g.331837 Transcript_118943/m.331837 type:complete len:205 (+) Transcript_118943:244-858(+)
MSSTTVKGEGSMMRCNGSRSPLGMLWPMMLSSPGPAASASCWSCTTGNPSLAPRSATPCPRPAAASRAASKCCRAMMPMQGPLSPSRTGKWQAWLSSRARRTAAALASGDSTASGGNGSQRLRATLLSSSRGASPSNSGRPRRRICSSSWPRRLILQLMVMAIATPSMTTGARLRSFTHSTTINTAERVICLKPQSIEALPTTA